MNIRKEQRTPSKKIYSLSWANESGLTHSAQVAGLDFSASGLGVLCAVAVAPGTIVYIQAQDGYPTGYSLVRHCTPREERFVIGLELDQAAKKTAEPPPKYNVTDHYEFLQISPNAEPETIHRVYRFLAARYHTDNPETGDPEKFVRLNVAYDVLSNSSRRAEYDAELQKKQARPNPVFESVDFLDGIEGEVNRRMAVLSLLYRRCRANVHNPKVSLSELETLMGFPREYLDFTTWYLRTKKYITVEDNSDFALTGLGVDYVESNYSKIPVLRRLLNAGTESTDRTRSKTVGVAFDTAPEAFISSSNGAVNEQFGHNE